MGGLEAKEQRSRRPQVGSLGTGQRWSRRPQKVDHEAGQMDEATQEYEQRLGPLWSYRNRS